MAVNINAPFGLKPLGIMGGAPANFANGSLKNGILNTNATAIYQWDLLQMTSSGQLQQWSTGVAVSQAWGVFMGCKYYSNSYKGTIFNNYWPGTTDAAAGSIEAFYIPFAMAPSTLWVCATDATGAATASIGYNCDLTTVGATGSTVTGFSGAFINLSSTATTATLPLRIVDLWVNRMGNIQSSTGTTGSQLFPGTLSGGFNWVVVAANTYGTTGV
jgi:hypothetical protein